MLLISNKDDVSIDLAKVQLLRGNNKIEAKRVGIFNRERVCTIIKIK